MEQSKQKADPIFAALLAVVGGLFLKYSFDIGTTGFGSNGDPGAHAFPAFLAVVLLFGAMYEAIRCAIRLLRNSSAAAEEVQPPSEIEPRKTAFASFVQSVNVVLMIVAVGVYLTAIHYAGFPIATFVFASSAMTYLGIRWWFALGTSVVLVGVIYVLFVLLFKVQLPAGLWFQ